MSKRRLVTRGRFYIGPKDPCDLNFDSALMNLRRLYKAANTFFNGLDFAFPKFPDASLKHRLLLDRLDIVSLRLYLSRACGDVNDTDEVRTALRRLLDARMPVDTESSMPASAWEGFADDVAMTEFVQPEGASKLLLVIIGTEAEHGGSWETFDRAWKTGVLDSLGIDMLESIPTGNTNEKEPAS